MWLFDNLRIQAALLKISILWPKKYGVPWVPAPMTVVHKMLQLAKIEPDDWVYDLGCGDGRMIVTAAREYGAHAVGIELDLLRYLWCQILITVFGLRGRVRIIYGDLFKQDLRKADIVTCYLSQNTNEALQRKFVQELQPSTRIVSYNYSFPKLNLVDENGEIKLYKVKRSPYSDGR
jgi:16S rRNA A1518/A1519 N6-dimethyltransferase RsmA/KsgA/DIM1 with predicted DNA glycosylase/AP lyase activity